jgi:hypothetical protein
MLAGLVRLAAALLGEIERKLSDFEGPSGFAGPREMILALGVNRRKLKRGA